MKPFPFPAESVDFVGLPEFAVGPGCGGNARFDTSVDKVVALGALPPEEGGPMRALDCSHPAHEEQMHFTAADDEALLARVKQHRDEYHPEMSDDEIREIVAQGAYEE